MGDELCSWGRFPRIPQRGMALGWRNEITLPSEEMLLPHGAGQSYGDVCLSPEGGKLILTQSLDQFLAFDADTGILRCESGVTFADVLAFAVPRGWFVPVTPGTKKVTLGGAVANDVHGKNHHRAGTFGCHLTALELLRSDGKRYICSPTENIELFQATIGGLGLTGLILWVEFKLKKIAGPAITVENIKFRNLDGFFEISSESNDDFDYTVAWLDCLATGADFGRGIFMRGNHSREAPAKMSAKPRKPLFSVPFDAPSLFLNQLSVKAFNALYFGKQRAESVTLVEHYEPFFYPLDVVGHWNRIYGKRGFTQFQCVVPNDKDHLWAREILKTAVDSKQASFLTVIKEFGDLTSPGMLSFPQPGITICLDFANIGTPMLLLLQELEHTVRRCGGRIYPAKDAVMSADAFQEFYPKWSDFAEFIDPQFRSNFWARVTRGE